LSQKKQLLQFSFSENIYKTKKLTKRQKEKKNNKQVNLGAWTNQVPWLINTSWSG
jgi:hypothetical protein